MGYLTYLIIGVLYYLFIFEKYKSKFTEFKRSIFYLYMFGTLAFFPSVILIEVFRMIRRYF